MATPIEFSQRLKRMIDRECDALRAIPEEQASLPSRNEGWTPKQELGHLIDSATNNHVRFVRGSIEPEMHGPGYAQNEWVAIHGYQELPWAQLVDFWHAYNSFLAHLVARIPEGKLDTLCHIGTYPTAPLHVVIEDYADHMQHHIDQILRRPQITPYGSAKAKA